MTLPTGNVTFFFTDIEGSTRLWEANLAAMGPALALHDRILREAVTTHHGIVFKTIGDAFCVVFNEAPDAVAAAAAAQHRLAETDWGNNAPLKVRIAIHTGVAELRESDYFGPVLNRVARLLAAGHGGQTLLSLATEELVHDRLPSLVTLRDLGENRLKDLARPERIYELIIEGLETQFPPLRSLERFPNNLPVQLTSFIGRENELAEVRVQLQSTHLLTLTGPGGTGKTRLSLQVAAELSDQFPDGIWLVEFATETDPENVPTNIATVLGLFDGEKSVEMALASFLRRKNLLLILDNCEHLITPIARLTETLLRQAPQLRILASSRTPLGIPGETTWPVPPLSVPEMSRWGGLIRYNLEELGRLESIRLFVDRAAAALPFFRLTAENSQAIARICYRLDGIALALELAAARVKVLSPEQIAERLQNRFSLLTGGSRTALPRQQTLRALIDWSYDLLSEKEHILFRRLAVFAGGRTLAAIEAVCADDELETWEMLDLLSQLLDKSLVSVESGPAGEPRYVFTESIFQYARQKLSESSESTIINDRHLAYFRYIAETAQPYLMGPEQARWLEKLAADRINFRMAIDWATKDSAHAEEGLRMATALTRFWEVRSDLREGREYFSNLLAVADPMPRLLLAISLGSAARLAWCQDDNTFAYEAVTQCIAMLTALGEEKQSAEFIAMRGFVERLENKAELAETSFRDCLAIAEKYHDERLRAIANTGLGSIASDHGKYTLADQLKRQSLETFRKLGDRYFIGLNSWSLASNALQSGLIDEAAALYRECSEIAIQLANRWIIPNLIEGAGNIARIRGDHEKGLTLFAAASVLRDRLGLSFAPLDVLAYQEILSDFQRALGEPSYATIWAQGRRLTPLEAAQLAFPGIKI
ncbi:MAG: adenylate/guanylate cyclase domain-containing protein [Chthoniobacterales bacterium]